MTTTKQANKTKTKKTGKKAESNFHAVRSLYKTGENWVETAKDYNHKYITTPLENSRDFVADMKDDPKKTFGDIFDNGKGFVEDVRKDPKKMLTDLVDGSKDLAEGAREDFFKAVETVLDGGRDFYTGMEKDTREILDDFVDRGKKFTDRIPGKEAVEKGISKSLEAVPDRLNLPSKKDMEKLSKTVRTLNTRLNTLSKQCAA